jgi:hypothetical protein
MTAWRRRRLALFRCTAFPIRLPAINPTRTRDRPGAQTTVISPIFRRRPVDSTRRKSSEVLRGSISSRESFAAFGSPGLDDGPSSTGRHSVPEAVLALATPNLGLKSSLHGIGTRERGTARLQVGTHCGQRRHFAKKPLRPIRRDPFPPGFETWGKPLSRLDISPSSPNDKGDFRALDGGPERQHTPRPRRARLADFPLGRTLRQRALSKFLGGPRWVGRVAIHMWTALWETGRRPV